MIDLAVFHSAARNKANLIAADLADENERLRKLKASGEKLGDNHWQRRHALQERLRVAEALERAFAEAGAE